MSVQERTVEGVNRTDRLHALVDELRAAAPKSRSARELARRFEVSARTIERDVSALQESGVPVRAAPGRKGGYTLDETPSLPPLGFTPHEAVAIALALSRAGDEQPFAEQARSALRKLVAAMPGPEGELARELARRVRMRLPGDSPRQPLPLGGAAVSRTIEEALLRRSVLRLEYVDRKGAATSRAVEPGVFLGGRGGFWYLVGWCRLREDVRVFRLDRIASAESTGERAPDRPLEGYAADVPEMIMRETAVD
ncbi:YafY family protein [Nonomuraea longicatena]|uniref:YafY family protein n=1 Tax=Nonomuraea longicatena TaxID=83682 RepID=A0ABN1NME2_9ACTN